MTDTETGAAVESWESTELAIWLWQ